MALPVFGRIAAGTPREALMQSDQTHDTPESLYAMHKRSFWLIVSGNSMNRLFPDGSLVLIDPATGEILARDPSADEIEQTVARYCDVKQ